MDLLKPTVGLLLIAAFIGAATESFAQSPGTAADIEKQLLSLYPTAKATADGTDIVTAGAVLVLQKDHLLMCKVDQAVATPNFYKKGVITQNGLGGFLKTVSFLNKFSSLNPAAGAVGAAGNAAGDGAASAAGATREFVTGEKFWVTQIDTRPDGVVFSLMSDPIKDQRYKATLKFPFAKGSLPSADDEAALVAEVIKIDAPAEQDTANAADKGGGQAPAPAETKTIAVGQTRDQVIAMFGVPSKVVQLGTKEMDYFPDMKVTFVKNKVTDVQ
jgi:hypothetical protein